MVFVFILQPAYAVYLFIFPPLVFFAFEAVLLLVSDAVHEFPFLAFPISASALTCGAAFWTARRQGVSWNTAMFLALVAGAVAFPTAGGVYVSHKQKSEAIRLGATCMGRRGFFTDLRSQQYWDSTSVYAHGSIQVDGKTLLWSYKYMTYSGSYPKALRSCVALPL